VEATYRPARRGLVWPILIVLLGIVFLLSNLGLISLNIWELLWWLWPIILIAIGLELLIGRRSMIGTVIVLLLTVVAIAIGAQAVGRTAGPVTGAETIVQPLGSATQAQIMLGLDAGDLTIRPLRDSANAIEATVDRRRNETLTRTQDAVGDTIIFGLNVDRSGPNISPPWGSTGTKTWLVLINPAVAAEIAAHTGAGAVTFDLAQLNVTRFEVTTGAGTATITLPAEGRLNGTIRTGAGEIAINVPEGMAVRVHGSTGLGSTDVPPGYQQQDGTWTSPGYASAANRADIEISTGVGAITIREVTVP
jgi:hypothetical protein